MEEYTESPAIQVAEEYKKSTTLVLEMAMDYERRRQHELKETRWTLIIDVALLLINIGLAAWHFYTDKPIALVCNLIAIGIMVVVVPMLMRNKARLEEMELRW